jgi:methylated-DNA-[protein]-cysteine S-methyltransferase
MPLAVFESPFGPLTLVADENGLRRLYFPGRTAALEEHDCDPGRLRAATEELQQYFTGQRTKFELPIQCQGTHFQRGVWRALQEIPYGTTTTYGEIARRLGSGTSASTHDARAVGAAVGATPIPIVIPCHRVIGANGSLTGYGGGLHRKHALLAFEASGGDPAALDSAWRQRQLTLM